MYENVVVAERLDSNTSNLDFSSPNISNSDSLSLEKPSDLVYQFDAPPDLKTVSWPRDRSLTDLKYYTYDRGGGQNAVIYVLENGIDPQNTVRVLSQRLLIVCWSDDVLE